MNNKATIRHNFSRHARRYDSFSLIQDQVGAALLGMVPDQAALRILDVGCGTGTFTRGLAQRFGQAKITALDLCPDMLEAARQKLPCDRIRWLCADAETVAFEQPFDLIVSNACLQWFDDLPATLQRYRQLLGPRGMLAFSAFGPLTFLELNQIVRKARGRSAHVHSDIFNNIHVYKTELRKHWGNVSIQEKIYSQTYDSLWDLLLAIKYTGTKGRGLAHRALTRSDINVWERDYRAQFGQIRVSYQVFYCTAKGKDV